MALGPQINVQMRCPLQAVPVSLFGTHLLQNDNATNTWRLDMHVPNGCDGPPHLVRELLVESNYLHARSNEHQLCDLG